MFITKLRPYPPNCTTFRNAKDAAQFVAMAKALNKSAPAGHHKVETVNVKVLTQFALTCQGSISPIASVFGGIVGQEVLKACSGKFSPIQQFLYLDSFESLPDKIVASDYALTKSRYDGQVWRDVDDIYDQEITFTTTC